MFEFCWRPRTLWGSCVDFYQDNLFNYKKCKNINNIRYDCPLNKLQELEILAQTTQQTVYELKQLHIKNLHKKQSNQGRLTQKP